MTSSSSVTIGNVSRKPSSSSGRLITSANSDAQHEPEQRADQRRDDGLEAHDALDLAPRHADRAQHPELARALEDRQRERVDDPEQRDDDRQRQQRVDEVQQLVDLARLLLLDLLAIVRLVVGEARRERAVDRRCASRGVGARLVAQEDERSSSLAEVGARCVVGDHEAAAEQAEVRALVEDAAHDVRHASCRSASAASRGRRSSSSSAKPMSARMPSRRAAASVASEPCFQLSVYVWANVAGSIPDDRRRRLLAGDLALGEAHGADRPDAGHARARRSPRPAASRRSRLRDHGQVAGERAVDGAVDRSLQTGGEDRHEATSATPTISAAAVTAVRAGLRIAFSRASRPVMPASRSSGAPTSAAIGRTSCGLKQRDAEEHGHGAGAERRRRAAARLAAEEP